MSKKLHQPLTDAERRAEAEKLADLYVLADAKAKNLDGWRRLVQCFLEHPEWMSNGGVR